MENKMKLVLNESDQELAKKYGEARRLENRKNGIVDKKRTTKMSKEEMDLYGIATEIAVGRYLGLQPDLSIRSRHGGHDLISENGVKIDVKYTSSDRGDLLLMPNKTLKDADVYIVCTGTFPVFEVAGWSYAKNVIKKENITNLGYGLLYKYPRYKLSKLETLRSIL
jgi:hypothetical protein